MLEPRLAAIVASMRCRRSSALGLRVLVAAAAFVLALALAGPALASVADEQREGAALVQALDAGKRDYKSLSSQDFERIGEYWMGRMIGSTQTHEAMNARMRQMMGADGEERMHELMGQRYARLVTSSATGGTSTGAYGNCGYGAGSMMGGYDDGCGYDDGWMMDGDYDYGPMMGMMMGNWRQMSRDDWQRMLDQFDRAAATTRTSSNGRGWDTRDAVFLGLAGLLAILLAASLAVRRPWRRHAAA